MSAVLMERWMDLHWADMTDLSTAVGMAASRVASMVDCSAVLKVVGTVGQRDAQPAALKAVLMVA